MVSDRFNLLPATLTLDGLTLDMQPETFASTNLRTRLDLIRQNDAHKGSSSDSPISVGGRTSVLPVVPQQDLDFMTRICKFREDLGSRAFEDRFQRYRGADPTIVEEREVLHIMKHCPQGSAVECIGSIHTQSKIGLAAILTGMAHQSMGGMVIIGACPLYTPATVLGCQDNTSEFVADVLARYIHPPLSSAVSTLSIYNECLVVLDIAPSRTEHGVGLSSHSLKFYRRIGSKTVALDAQELADFRGVLDGRYSGDSAVVPGAELTFSSRRRCFQVDLVPNEECSHFEQQLALQGCNLYDPITQQLTRAGLLLTGTTGFQSRLPLTGLCTIGCFFSSQGSCRADLRGLQQQYDIRTVFDGPILEMVENAARWVGNMQRTPYSKRLVTAAGSDSDTASSSATEGALLYVGQSYRQYAPQAVMELLVNACCHRDYDKAGMGIQVWMFEKMLEIVVPGDVMPDAGDLNQQPRRAIRNMSLYTLLSRANNPETGSPYFKGTGTGIAVAKSHQQQQGGDITYCVEPGQVVVKVTAMSTPSRV